MSLSILLVTVESSQFTFGISEIRNRMSALPKQTHEIAPGGCSYGLGGLYCLGDFSTQANSWRPRKHDKSRTRCFEKLLRKRSSSKQMQSTMSTSPMSVLDPDIAIAIFSRFWVLNDLISHVLWPSTTSCANGGLIHKAKLGRLPSAMEQNRLST